MRKIILLLALASLSACGDEDVTPSRQTTSAAMASPELKPTATISDISWTSSEAGITPFIAIAHLAGERLVDVEKISYVIDARPGSVSKPVRVSYTLDALDRQGRVSPNQVSLPVFGLYAGSANAVTIRLTFEDCSTQDLAGTVTTAAYTGPSAFYDQPLLLKSRAAGSELGFDFFAMKSGVGTPVIVDTDGALRWVGVSTDSSISSAFTDNGFVIGDQRTTRLWRLELDGSVTPATFAMPSNYRRFHHNIDEGRNGLLAEFDTLTDRETTITELTVAGGITKVWDFAQIVRDHMTAAGDDPSLFVRPGVDWFHTNATVYDASTNSLIVSSRENFIMSVDYDTGAIRWVLGDPTKYWYSFPSLRAKALTITGPGLYPIGQHALSFTTDGLLLTFNAGTASESQPAGAPIGESRSYSVASAYRIDAAGMTATEVWNFDYGRTLYSDHCGSAYEGPGQSILISYARADDRTHARLVALNREHEVVFDWQYDSRGCNTSWNAVPVPLEDMRFL